MTDGRMVRKQHGWPRPRDPTERRNSRFLVVDSEADEVPVVGGPVTVPPYDDVILPCGRRGEVQDVAFTWGTKVYP